MEECTIEAIPISFTGIHLRSRGSPYGSMKTVREGYMYTINYTSYPADVEIMFLLIMKDSSEVVEYLPRKALTKFGGEGRVVKIYVERPNKSNLILNTLSKIMETRYAILISPMLLRDKDYTSTSFMSMYTTIGYGYSFAKKRRKPISTCINEGLIIKLHINKEIQSLKETFSYGLYATLDLIKDNYYKYMGRLGYASFLPIKIDIDPMK